MFNRAALLLGLAITAGPASAAPVEATRPGLLPDSESADYTMRYLGMDCGEAHASWDETARHYTASVTVLTTGAAAVFSAQDVTMTVSGSRMQVAGGKWRYVPASFHFVNRSKKRPKEVTVLYDTAGNVASVAASPDKVEGPEDVRPPVSAARDRGTDPVTLLTWLGSAALFGDPSPSALQYDGIRLTRLTAAFKRLDERDNADPNRKIYAISRQPIEGYTPKELRKLKDDSAVTIALRPSESRFPEIIRASLSLGTMTIERTR